jgi:hypothetical protein
MKLKTDSSGVAVPPRVRWWLLPVPFVAFVLFAVALARSYEYRHHSLAWLAIDRVWNIPSRMTQPPFASLLCLVSESGRVDVIAEEGSWDAIEAALRRGGGSLWLVTATRGSTFHSIVVPSFERVRSRCVIAPAVNSSDPPDEHAIGALRFWIQRSSELAAKDVRRIAHSQAILQETHTELRPLWGNIALNAGLLALLLLLPFSAVAWSNVARYRRFRHRVSAGLCVHCKYMISAPGADAPQTCPECGTLNPPSPIPPQPSSHSSPPAPSSSPTPSEQSAPPPPEPPATTQSPRR